MGNVADLHHEAEGPVPPPTEQPVSLELTATPVLSQALAYNEVPVVSRLAVHSATTTVRGATVRLSVADDVGPVGPPVERLVDLEAGRTTVVGDVGLTLDAGALLQVPERRSGWVRVELTAGDRTLASRRLPVHVLAPGQWLATPSPLALELLAAHVLPHDPAVGRLLDDACDLLEEGTGSRALSGYDEGPERVDEVVDALVWAMRRRSVRPTLPPVSWTEVGQVVRTPDEVLDGGVGTSLDTTLTLAAACERAGLRPLVWVADGHAFCGYWREERGTETAATTDVAGLVNLVDLGVIRLVETTLLAAGGSNVADLHRPAYAAWLTGDLGRLLGVTDVVRARREGVRALPVHTAGDVVLEHRAAAGPAEEAVEAAAGSEPAPSAPDARPEVPARVQQWKNALLDLSPRNRLISYGERAGVPLTVPHDVLPLLEELLTGGTTLTLLPGDALSEVQRERGVRSARELPAELLTETLAERRAVHADVPEAGYLSRLRGLAHRARTVVEETGADNLYLALGSLVWEADGRPLRSPLVLLPVLLSPASRTGAYRLTADEAGAATPNWCLLEKLRQLHGLTVPGLAEGADGVRLGAAVQAVREALAERGLPWRVEPTADLAVLQFAKHRLWQDLDQHWADLARNPLVAHLIHDPNAPFTDPAPDTAGTVDLDELAAGCPLPADASQLRAVAEAVAGRTFVLEGPPGTGKSQTITNLLTRAVAEGKRVLFVAEKRAALDVVARRLDAVGMGPFALDLHDKGSRPAVVRAQIRAALDHAVEVDEQGLAADAEDLRSARRSLDRYAERLHAPNPAGLSYYSARTAVLAAGDAVPPLPVPPAFAGQADAETVTGVRRALALLPDIADLARPSAGHAWAFLDTVDIDIEAVQRAAVAVDSAIRELPGEGALAAVLRAVRTPEDLDDLAHLLAGPPLGLDVLDQVRSPRWAAALDDLLADVEALAEAGSPAFDVVTPDALGLPLGELFVQAQEAAAGSFLGRRGKLAEVRARFAGVLADGATVRTKDVPELTASLRTVQSAVQALAARATAVPGLQVPAGWNPFTDAGRTLLAAEARWLRRAAATADGSVGLAGAVRRLLVAGPASDPAAARLVLRLRDAVTALLTACGSSSAQLAAWSGEQGLVLHWTMTRPERGVEYIHPMSLRRWVSLLDTLEPLRLTGLTEARRLLVHGELPAEDAVRAFDRGLAEASLAERRDATGLSAFDAGRHEATITRFAAASRAVRSHLTCAVPAGVLAARPFDPATGDSRVGALQRELAKQRRGLGVRGLLAAHGDLITSVLPCVLVSPDSVARFFPADADLFDLVVFDEASQIRVADAIGALGRARTAVVVGDSKQLPPTTFGEPSAADDEPAEDTVADEESILSECVQARVPRQWLSWHYRSQDETLIAFSNAQYYDNRLATFPAPAHGRASSGAGGRGVSLVRVAGTFHRTGGGKLLRTNPVEAAAVVAEVLRRFEVAAPAVPSIGVVTFNAPQRSLIEAQLRDSGDQRVVDALDRTDGEGLFVKNLENVQGDERDVVFFSTGFSPDERGNLPLNFGPLNRAGGERRLNVAVTRARHQVVVFTSFAPEQLRAEQTASLGVQHLRAYLDLAALGTDALPRGARPAGAPDRHRDEIAAALRERGLVVRTDVGLSDFRVDLTVARAAAPDAPVLAVLLDGPAWARRRTVGDRDGLPVEVLSGLLGWPAVERVWLPTWLVDAGAVVDRLVAAVDATPPPRPAVPAEPPAAVAAPALEPRPVEDAATTAETGIETAEHEVAEHEGPLADVIPIRPVARVAQPTTVPEPTVPEPTASEPVVAAPEPVVAVAEPGVETATGTPAAATPAGTRPATTRSASPRPAEPGAPLDEELPFIAWAPKPAGDRKQLDQLGDPAVQRVVRRVLNAGIKAEGPVHRDRLARLTAGAFGLTRVGAARRDALMDLLPPSALQGEHLWPKGTDPAEWTWFRRQATAAERPLEQVAPREVGNAMVALTRAAGSLAVDELRVRTAEVFGHRRLTPAAQPPLDAALQAAVAAGRLTVAADGTVTA
ncbi:DUF3320 domain-containing protein [Modestobacter sp. SYSU DS0657]